MTPKPIAYLSWYENNFSRTEHDRTFFLQQENRSDAIEWIKEDFDLDPSTPEEIIKDILLDNGFTEYAELLFPESKE